MPLTDRGSYLRLLSDHIYDTDRVLQLLPVYICAGAELYDLRGSGIFPGSVPDHQHRIADRHVGNPHFVESGCTVFGVDHDPEAESAGIYCQRLPKCDL